MATPRTLIIGDEEAIGLFDALKRLPAALDPGPMWLRAYPASSMQWWAEHQEVKGALDDIANPKNVAAPDRPIDTVLVALGRQEVLTEPDSPDQKDIDLIVGDAVALVDQIQALGKYKVAWIMPLFAGKEGKTRAALDAALRKKGIAMMPTIYHPRDHLSDPSVRGEYPKDIPAATFDMLARLAQAGVPLRGSGWKPSAPSTAGQPLSADTGGVTNAYAASVEAVRGLPAGVKVVGVLALLGLGVGVTYAASRRR